MHDVRSKAIEAALAGIIMLLIGVGLYYWTGAIMLGAPVIAIGIIGAIARAVNSFGEERRLTDERECGNRGDSGIREI